MKCFSTCFFREITINIRVKRIEEIYSEDLGTDPSTYPLRIGLRRGLLWCRRILPERKDPDLLMGWHEARDHRLRHGNA